MGSKPTKVNDRDVPAHNPLMNNDHLRMHYFKDRKEADETQIRQENHFTIINKNGVVDNGRTLVGLRKPGHKSKIYFIRKRPKKFGPQEDSSVDDSASENMERIRKSSMSSFSQSEHLSLPDHQIDQSANMFDSQYVNEDQRMIIDERDSEFSDEQDPIRHSRLSKKQSNHEYLDTEEDGQIINVNTDRNKNNSQDVSSKGRQVTFEDNKRDESDSDGELSAHNQSSDGEELSAHNQPSDEEQEIVKPNEKIKSQPMENFRDSENSGDQELSQEEVNPQQQLPEQEVEEVKQIHPPSNDEKEDSINEPQQIESDHKQEEVKRQQPDSDSDQIEDFKHQEQESDEEEKEIEPKITKIVVADQENSFEDVQNDSVYREDRKEELNERSPLVHTKEDVTDAQLNADHIQSVPFEEQENVAELEKVAEKASPSPKKKKKKRGKKKRVRANEQPLEEVEEPEIPEDNNSDNDA